MATRWDVEKAVLWSEMDPSPRLIVLALLTKADNDTGVISAEHTPALDTLASMTGLSRSAVAEWLNALEDAGWVKRTRPPAGSRIDRQTYARTTYALLVGAQTVVRRARPREVASRPPRGPVRHADASAVRPADLSRPPRGPASTKNPLPKPLSKTSRRRTDEEPRRDDVERICEHLADRIAANGSKRPPITKGWRTAARLMLDRDQIPEALIIGAINWCQNDIFWRSNILSMPKLRQRYDQLRLQAIRGRGADRDPAGDAVAAGKRLQAMQDHKELTS